MDAFTPPASPDAPRADTARSPLFLVVAGFGLVLAIASLVAVVRFAGVTPGKSVIAAISGLGALLSPLPMRGALLHRRGASLGDHPTWLLGALLVLVTFLPVPGFFLFGK